MGAPGGGGVLTKGGGGGVKLLKGALGEVQGQGGGVDQRGVSHRTRVIVQR